MTSRWLVRLAAFLTAVMGLLDVASAVTPSIPERVARIADWSPLVVRHGLHLAAALSGFALLLLAAGLARRKQAAWLLTQVALTISAFSHVLKGLDYEEAAVAVALALFLAVLRPEFHARSDRPSTLRGLVVVLSAFVFVLIYGVSGFWLLDHQFSVNFGFWAAVRQTVLMFSEFYDPGLVPVTRFGAWFADSIYTVGAATFGYGLFMLARPVLLRRLATPEERARARAIVEAHGRSSLAFFALGEDKSLWFSPGGSVVSFVVQRRVALALGDPVGPAADADAAIRGFVAHCGRNDWRPAFYQTMPDHLAHYRDAGLDASCVGHEAIVELARFTLEGTENKALRGAVNRLTRGGYRAEMFEPPIPHGLIAELREVSDEWLALTRATEMRFSLGAFDDDYIRDCPVMAVVSSTGRITAFTNLVPEYQLDESTCDLMRFRAGVENGTMDFLLVRLFEWARARGYATFNLGLSALAGVGERRDDPATERALAFLYRHLNRFYSFKGIHAFKSKFHPRWEPRYLVHPGAASLPAVGLALLLADSGGNVLLARRTEEARLARPAAALAPAADESA
jgi:phosphatidylglycerol lysyltransferase